MGSAIRKLLRVIKRRLLVIAGCANIPLCLAISLGRLMIHYRVLQEAQVVVVMPEGGFGHTIQGPDVTRRLFPNRRCVFIALSEYKRHNWKVAAIWPDIRVIFLPTSLGFDLDGRSLALPWVGVGWLKAFVPRMICRFVRIVAGRSILFLSIHDLYSRIPVPDVLRPVVERLPLFSHQWSIAWFRLQREVPAPPVRLPREWRDRIRQRLAQVAAANGHTGSIRICGLYLRQKGLNSADITNSRRIGSPLKEYLPAICLLNRVGYQVLLTGDVSLDSSLYDEFDGMLTDAKSLGIDKEWFALFAATEADIFIGEAGGGAWLPGLCGIPRLLLNGFPYGYRMPNSWVYYKTVRDRTGMLVHFSKLFSEHAYDYELPGMTLHHNSAEEIYQAVSCFIVDVSRAEEPDQNGHIVAQLPDHTWIKQANARLSPAFVKLFDGASRTGISGDSVE